MSVLDEIKKIIEAAKKKKKKLNKIKNKEKREKKVINTVKALIELIIKLDLKALDELKKEEGNEDFVEFCEEIWLLATEAKNDIEKLDYESAKEIFDKIILIGKHALIEGKNLENIKNWDFDDDRHVPGYHLHIRYKKERTKWKLTYKDKIVYYEAHAEGDKLSNFPNADKVRNKLRTNSKIKFEAEIKRGGTLAQPTPGKAKIF